MSVDTQVVHSVIILFDDGNLGGDRSLDDNCTQFALEGQRKTLYVFGGSPDKIMCMAISAATNLLMTTVRSLRWKDKGRR